MAVSATEFNDSFDSLDKSFWYRSDFTMRESWIHNAWSESNVTVEDGVLELKLDTLDRDGKSFTGAEFQTLDRYGFGRYEVDMQASGEKGVNSSFFTYTGPYFGHTWNEIDFEFLGKDPTKVSVGYHFDGKNVAKSIDLPFDASKGMHSYAFEWEPDGITWYADGNVIFDVDDSLSVKLPDTPSKLIMNIWTGLNGWLGKPEFESYTTAKYDNVSFTPFGEYTSWSSPSNAGNTGGDGVVSDSVTGSDVVLPPPQAHPPATPEPTPQPTGNAGDVKLMVYDAKTDKVIGTLEDGDTLPVAPKGSEWTVVAVTPTGVESVKFELSGPTSLTRTENIKPFAMFGDEGKDLLGGTVKAGDYTLTVTGHSADGAKGTQKSRDVVHFNVADSTPEPAHKPTGNAGDVKLMIYDAKTDKVIGELEDGDTLPEAPTGSEWTVVAVTPAGVESVKFDLSGPTSLTRTESIKPFAMFGDEGKDLLGGTVKAGDYTLTVTGHSADGAKGTQKSKDVVHFNVADSTPEPSSNAADLKADGDMAELKLYLFDTENDKIITELSNYTKIDTSIFDFDHFGIVAKSSSADVESVAFDLHGPVGLSHIENHEPYSLFGDDNGDINGQAFHDGYMTLSAAAYDEDRALGDLLAYVEVDLFVK